MCFSFADRHAYDVARRLSMTSARDLSPHERSAESPPRPKKLSLAHVLLKGSSGRPLRANLRVLRGRDSGSLADACRHLDARRPGEADKFRDHIDSWSRTDSESRSASQRREASCLEPATAGDPLERSVAGICRGEESAKRLVRGSSGLALPQPRKPPAACDAEVPGAGAESETARFVALRNHFEAAASDAQRSADAAAAAGEGLDDARAFTPPPLARSFSSYSLSSYVGCESVRDDLTGSADFSGKSISSAGESLMAVSDFGSRVPCRIGDDDSDGAPYGEDEWRNVVIGDADGDDDDDSCGYFYDDEFQTAAAPTKGAHFLDSSMGESGRTRRGTTENEVGNDGDDCDDPLHGYTSAFEDALQLSDRVASSVCHHSSHSSDTYEADDDDDCARLCAMHPPDNYTLAFCAAVALSCSSASMEDNAFLRCNGTGSAAAAHLIRRSAQAAMADAPSGRGSVLARECSGDGGGDGNIHSPPVVRRSAVSAVCGSTQPKSGSPRRRPQSAVLTTSSGRRSATSDAPRTSMRDDLRRAATQLRRRCLENAAALGTLPPAVPTAAGSRLAAGGLCVTAPQRSSPQMLQPFPVGGGDSAGRCSRLATADDDAPGRGCVSLTDASEAQRAHKRDSVCPCRALRGPPAQADLARHPVQPSAGLRISKIKDGEGDADASARPASDADTGERHGRGLLAGGACPGLPDVTFLKRNKAAICTSEWWALVNDEPSFCKAAAESRQALGLSPLCAYAVIYQSSTLSDRKCQLTLVKRLLGEKDSAGTSTPGADSSGIATGSSEAAVKDPHFFYRSSPDGCHRRKSDDSPYAEVKDSHRTYDFDARCPEITGCVQAIDALLGLFGARLSKEDMERRLISAIKDLSSTLESLVCLGMKEYRVTVVTFGKITARADAWDVVEEATAAARGESARQLTAALDDVKQLGRETPPPELRFSMFICGLLNHRCLDLWLQVLRHNSELLDKYYEDGAFLKREVQQNRGGCLAALAASARKLSLCSFELNLSEVLRCLLEQTEAKDYLCTSNPPDKRCQRSNTQFYV